MRVLHAPYHAHPNAEEKRLAFESSAALSRAAALCDALSAVLSTLAVSPHSRECGSAGFYLH